MSKFISIDPGLRACGCALFVDGRLLCAQLVKNTEKKLRGPQAHLKMAIAVGEWVRTLGTSFGDLQIVVEYPRIYPNHSNKQVEDPNDLLELAGVDGAIAAWFMTHPRHYFPADWKGQMPKKVMNERVLKTLFPEESAALRSTDHNTLDGVGIGLHHLSRL